MDRTGPAPPFGRRSWIRKAPLRRRGRIGSIGWKIRARRCWPKA